MYKRSCWSSQPNQERNDLKPWNIQTSSYIHSREALWLAQWLMCWAATCGEFKLPYYYINFQTNTLKKLWTNLSSLPSNRLNSTMALAFNDPYNLICYLKKSYHIFTLKSCTIDTISQVSLIFLKEIEQNFKRPFPSWLNFLVLPHT